jgi:hypothetical protein
VVEVQLPDRDLVRDRGQKAPLVRVLELRKVVRCVAMVELVQVGLTEVAEPDVQAGRSDPRLILLTGTSRRRDT